MNTGHLERVAGSNPAVYFPFNGGLDRDLEEQAMISLQGMEEF